MALIPHLGIALSIEALKELRERFLPTSQEKLDEARREILDDLTVELDLALRTFVERQLRANAGFENAMAAKLDRREVLPLVLVLLEEAFRSATRARLRMMCAAAAGTLNPNIDAEMKSRIVRVLARLEPSDVRYLREIRDRTYPTEPDTIHGDNAVRFPVQMMALSLGGCIVVTAFSADSTDPSGAELTPVGRALLEFLQDWTPGAEARP